MNRNEGVVELYEEVPHDSNMVIVRAATVNGLPVLLAEAPTIHPRTDGDPLKVTLSIYPRRLTIGAGIPEEPDVPAPGDKGRTDRCVDCGSTRVSYENYLDQLFCWPCADGQDWPKHPRAPRENKGETSKMHIRQRIDPDMVNPAKDAKRFTIGGRG